jgi:hypothetical protein
VRDGVASWRNSHYAHLALIVDRFLDCCFLGRRRHFRLACRTASRSATLHHLGRNTFKEEIPACSAKTTAIFFLLTRIYADRSRIGGCSTARNRTRPRWRSGARTELRWSTHHLAFLRRKKIKQKSETTQQKDRCRFKTTSTFATTKVSSHEDHARTTKRERICVMMAKHHSTSALRGRTLRKNAHTLS